MRSGVRPSDSNPGWQPGVARFCRSTDGMLTNLSGPAGKPFPQKNRRVGQSLRTTDFALGVLGMIKLNRIGNKLGFAGAIGVLLAVGMVANQMMSEAEVD